MSENDNELKQALAENGEFDPDRAATIKKQTVADFDAKLRKVERIMWIYLSVCVCVAVSAIRAFERSSNTKELILYAIVFLVAFETTILMKLWYWVVNTKISVVKELKLLRLAQTTHRDPAEKYGTEGLRAGLSRWERIVWMAILIACALVVPNVLLPTVGAYKAGLRCDTYVTLDVDGGGTLITKMEFRNGSGMPMTSLTFNAPASDEIRWLGQQGGEMPATAVSKDDRNQYTVELPKPLMPGEWLTYTRITKSSQLAEEQNDGLWVYRFDECHGFDGNDFVVHTLLPEEAKSVSLQTEGGMEHACQLNDRRIFVNGRRDRNEHFQFTVEYSLSTATL